MNRTTINPKEFCILKGCITGAGPWCTTCGWNTRDDDRRKRIPLVTDENGISRKHVGVPTNGTDE